MKLLILAALAAVAAGENICTAPQIFSGTQGDVLSFSFNTIVVDRARNFIFQESVDPTGWRLVYSGNDDRIYNISTADNSCVHSPGTMRIPGLDIPVGTPKILERYLDGEKIGFYKFEIEDGHNHYVAVDQECRLKFIYFVDGEHVEALSLWYNMAPADSTPDFDPDSCSAAQSAE